MTTLGLTWDHPRGYRPLEAAAARERIDLEWRRQTLAGFESRPLEELAGAYDLLVIDHPHVGEAHSLRVLRPLDDLAGELGPAVGRSLESYRYGGRLWALPLDAAAQVCAIVPERFDAPPPGAWAEALMLARRLPAVLPLAGPHAALALFAIAAAYGDPPGRGPAGTLFRGDGARAAWEVLSRLLERCDPAGLELDPIAVLERLARREGASWCPLVYGYVTYALRDGVSEPLRFHDAPAAFAGGVPGSILGGTGLAVSALRPVPGALLAHAVRLAGELQLTEIPASGGQPAARAAWLDRSLDVAASGFYSGTRRTLEHAVVRPRFPGYVPFQTAAGEAVRASLRRRERPGEAIGALQRLYLRYRPAGSEL